METIELPRKIIQIIFHQALLDTAIEVCGLIGGINNKPVSCYPIKNVAEHPDREFNMDAEAQIDAQRTMCNRNETLFAIYHSHPTTPAEPSQRDIDLSAYPEALYLIISLQTKGVLEIRGFRIQNGQQFSETPLLLSHS
ncbi:MAG: M67 family metallopeptidase [Methylococcaceae bacterium]